MSGGIRLPAFLRCDKIICGKRIWLGERQEMRGKVYLVFYRLPLYKTVVMLVLVLMLWSGLCARVRGGSPQLKRIWLIACCAAALLWLLVTLHLTLFSRMPGSYGVSLRPFSQLRTYLADGNREIIRSIWMNVLLFVPPGLTLPELISKNRCRVIRALSAVAAAALISAAIELCQRQFSLGELAVDDVIANTLGALLGVIPFCLFGQKKRESKPPDDPFSAIK